MGKKLSIFHGCLVWIEKSVTRDHCSASLGLKVGSLSLEGIIILLIYFSKLSESAFYREINKFQQKVKK